MMKANKVAMKRNGVCLLCMGLVSSALAQSWVQLGGDIDGEADRDMSGSSISLSSDGTRVAIATRQVIAVVRIYEYAGGNWIQLGTDINSGSAVSLSGDGTRVAIGALGYNGNGSESGRVQIYEYSEGNWIQLGADINGEAAGDYSGWSVSLSSDGSRVAIGAPGNEGNAGPFSGHVRIYEFTGGSWDQLGNDIDGERQEDFSGAAVSLSPDGSRVAIGAPNNNAKGMYSGHVRVYNYNGTVWRKLGADIDGEADDDYSGSSVSLSADGNRVAIGAPGNDGNAGPQAGHVRIYEYNGVNNWIQLGADIDGEMYDELGVSVSLSSDGSRVAIGAKTDISEASSDYVRIYEYAEGNWLQLGADINGEAQGDLFGASVSISSDGNRVAIGAPHNNGSAFYSGHVRVFEFLIPLNISITGDCVHCLTASNAHYSLLATTDLNAGFDVVTNFVGDGKTISIPIDSNNRYRFYKYRWDE